jgi:hypothetical protein
MITDNLNIDESGRIKGEIYKITNKQTGMLYIGQTRTHRKNKNKYRYFGYIGRFNDHISEAIHNTKKKQCTYLNNAIRLDKTHFVVELIEKCDVKDLDEKEKMYINQFNSYYPNGYNLTKGGKTTKYVEIESNQALNNIKKRGREYGYKHTETTKEKMKKSLQAINSHLKNKASTDDSKKRTSDNIIKYYDNQKIKKLAMFDLDQDIEKYIKPVSKNNEICGYKIYIDRENVFKACSKLESLPDIYNRLKHILIEAKKLSENC